MEQWTFSRTRHKGNRGEKGAESRHEVRDSPERPGMLGTLSLMATELPPPTARAPSRFSRVRLYVTPWTVARQAPPSMGFSRQECWNGLPFPSLGDLPGLGIKATSSSAGRFFNPEPPGKPMLSMKPCIYDFIYISMYPNTSVSLENAN